MEPLPSALPASPDRELATSRTLPFPRSIVQRAWTDPHLLREWWGPEGFSSTFHHHEPAPGGVWRHTMHGPNGADYANQAIYRSIDPGRIELAHVSEPRFDLIATFEEREGGTHLTFLQRFASAAVREAVSGVCIPANEENLDRLTRVLARAERELALSRIVEAPRETVFRLATDPRQLTHWWGPHGYSVPEVEMELRAGGLFRSVMRAPDGTLYPSSGSFLEVVPPERFVFTDGYEPDFRPAPQHFMTGVFLFEALGPHRTRVTARAMHRDAEDRAKHEEMGFYDGWGQMLDRLAALAQTPPSPSSARFSP